VIVLYFLETYSVNGVRNMAIDTALGVFSSELNDIILRFYTWEVPTLSLGKHQDVDDVDFEYLERNGFDIVRRPSGGRAVLHWDELTYSVIVPKGHELAKLSVLELYNTISKILVDGLRSLGYPVEWSEGKKKPVSHVCFQVPSTYEITLNGVKVVGSAQTRTQDYILQHGSIVLIAHPEVKYCFKSTKYLDIKFVGLYDYAKKGMEEISRNLLRAFEKYFGSSKKISKVLFENVLEKSREYESNFIVDTRK